MHDQHLVGGGLGLVDTAQAAQGGGEAGAGHGVARIDLDLAGPEGGAGQRIEAVSGGALLRCRLAGRLGRRGGLDRGGGSLGGLRREVREEGVAALAGDFDILRAE